MRAQRVVIYTRISRDDTGRGLANDRQEAECRRKAEYRRYDVVDVVADISKSAYSGKERPGWKRVLNMVRNGEVDVILAYHLDRVTRSMKDLEELIDLAMEHGVGIDFATGDIELTTDVGRMVARILAAVARAEVERKSARQKLAYQQRAEQGLPHSVKCFGYEDGNMEIIPAEAEALRRAARDVLDGVSLSAISRRWREEFPTRAPLTVNGVQMALANPRYVSTRLYHGKNMGQGQWPAIFDMDTHLTLLALFNDPVRRKGTIKRGRRPSTLLANIATCSVCEQSTKATKAHGKLIYGCRLGNHTNVVRSNADAWVLALLGERLSRPDFLNYIVQVGKPDTVNVEEVQQEAQELRDRKDKLARAFVAGAIDEQQLAAGTAELTSRMAEIDAVLSRSVPLPPSLTGLSIGSPRVVEEIMALPLERQRALVESVLEIRLVPRGKGRRQHVPIEEQVVVTPVEEIAA